MQPLVYHWLEWSVCQILRREAGAVLGIPDPHEDWPRDALPEVESPHRPDTGASPPH